MAEKITRQEFSQIRREFGKKAARNALFQFRSDLVRENEGGLGGLDKRGVARRLGKGFLGDNPVVRDDATFEAVRETAAVIQGRLQGSNEVGNKKARIFAKAALRPRPEDQVNSSRQRLATQRLRAGRFASDGSAGGANAGLFAPAHLARQRLIRSPLFARGIG